MILPSRIPTIPKNGARHSVMDRFNMSSVQAVHTSEKSPHAEIYISTTPRDNMIKMWKIKRYTIRSSNLYFSPSQQVINGCMNSNRPYTMIPTMKNRIAVSSQKIFMVFLSLPSAIRLPMPAFMPSLNILTRKFNLLMIIV